jgi:TolA-binding protein
MVAQPPRGIRSRLLKQMTMMKTSGFQRTAIPGTGWLSCIIPRAARKGLFVLAIAFAATGLSGCAQMTVLRTHELRQLGEQIELSRAEVAALQKSVDDLNLQQGGSTSKMRADLTAMLTDLQSQITRLHAEIDETQHRMGQLNQKLDRLDGRKVVVTPADTAGKQSATVKVVPGLDLEHLFGQAREDFIRGRYDLAYQGFKGIYEKDNGSAWREQSLYWMAECFSKGGRADRALELYARLHTEFPEGSQRCAAWLKTGLIYDEQKDIARRNEAFNALISACPQSNEAERAKDILRQ